MDWASALKIYDDIVEACKGFERKGKKMIYTSTNGYMFSLLNKDGEIGIRLNKEEANRFKESYNSGDYYSYGAKMKDYVLMPEDMYGKKELLVTYFEKIFTYSNSLPPK